MSTNALEVSDEEFMANPLVFDDEVAEEEEVIENDVSEDDEESADESGDESDGEGLADAEGADTGDDEPSETVDEADDDDEVEPLDESDAETEEVAAEDSDDSEEDETPPDLEAFHKNITAPFKANGKMIQVETAEDVIRLMQMGANYSRKMGALKPQMKVLRMLENHDLLDEDKLSFLIDLNKKDPQAINQLLRDSDIDPMELNLDEGQKYERKNYSVSDSEIDLDSVVEELESSEHFQPVLNVVTKQWDAQSRQIVADQPELLKVIHDHMASGIYDIVSTEVEKERMFGRLSGVSDLEAYRLAGDSLNEKGAFDHLFNPPAADEQESGQQPKPRSKTKPDGAEEQKRREKRRAASPTKRAARGQSADDFNPLEMSDEEFLKQIDPRFS